MKTSRIVPVLAGLCLFLISAAPAPAEEFPYPRVDYSADLEMGIGAGPDGTPMVINGRLFVSKGNERYEMNQAGRRMIVIKPRGQDVSWTLFPEQKSYLENPLSQQENNPEHAIRKGDVKLIKLGSEKVNGIQASKYRMDVNKKDGGQFNGLLWLTKENIPVRIEGRDAGAGPERQMTVDYKNIRIATQRPALFQIPSGYTKMAIPVMPGHPRVGAMPGRRMPKGLSPGGMTEEEAKMMRKQMEDMMKKFPQQPQ